MPGWIHGRNVAPDLPTMGTMKVVVIGCGSLGAPLAIGLAQAGAGSLDLVDPGILRAANVGRHPLGVSEIGLFKAKALAARIQADYPHILHVEGHPERWEVTSGRAPERLANADLLNLYHR